MKKQFKESLSATGKFIGDTLGGASRRTTCAIANTKRRLFRSRIPDYPVVVLSGEITERTPQKPWWWYYLPDNKPPITLEEISTTLQSIAGDPDTRGVIFLCKGISMGLSQAQSMNALFERFHGWAAEYHQGASSEATSKEVIIYIESLGIPTYLIASGADKVVIAPLTSWDVFGFRFAPTFWKDTLAKIGVEFEVLQIAPWKTAMDTVGRNNMSDAMRDQLNWLLDNTYDELVATISKGRGIEESQVRALIDQAPLTATQAKEAGLVDEIAYEDNLPELLAPQSLDTGTPDTGTPDTGTPDTGTPDTGTPDDENADAEIETKPEQASLKLYSKVRGLMFRHPKKKAPKAIGVISLSGAILVGKSRSYPVDMPLTGEDTIGSTTAQQVIRAARENPMLGAVILHVDSPGGSALASDLIWRELKLLDEEKPLVIYMGTVAASGGYYIATPGRKIVAQGSTLTGSIGVVTAKPATSGIYERIGATEEVLQRGENAGIYTSSGKWSDEQRTKLVETGIEHTYKEFKQRVADSRGLDFDGLDEICHGRVWTGSQALELGLIDAVGDFQVAVEMACELAELPTDGTVQTITVTADDDSVLASPVKAAEEMLGLSTSKQWTQLADDVATLLKTKDWTQLFGKERYWLMSDLGGLDKFLRQ
ncbi:MAG: signal peptide peptidase SppA [Chloroflexota bacterium]